MTESMLLQFITSATMGELLKSYPLAADFFANMRLRPAPEQTLAQLLGTLSDLDVEDFGIKKPDIPLLLCRFLLAFSQVDDGTGPVDALTILGGRNKSGDAEVNSVTLRTGEVASIVGPTGSGKSRLLADIECLAQADTPTGRKILINGKELTDDQRFEMNGKLVAQLSQNMNFIMDLTVGEFLELHARSRFSLSVEETVNTCLECANRLAGEPFNIRTKVTQLSGGQSRALMIADTAYMSSSPLVLIDEIENAGIDRKQAVGILSKRDKIVLIATHDPLLALSADKRLVIRNGGIFDVIETTRDEKAILVEIDRMDEKIQRLKSRLRAGEFIEEI
jgi:ABC-type lipoprotein export system ATPase subunit